MPESSPLLSIRNFTLGCLKVVERVRFGHRFSSWIYPSEMESVVTSLSGRRRPKEGSSIHYLEVSRVKGQKRVLEKNPLITNTSSTNTTYYVSTRHENNMKNIEQI